MWRCFPFAGTGKLVGSYGNMDGAKLQDDPGKKYVRDLKTLETWVEVSV